MANTEADTETILCHHDECDCEIPEGQRFCSPYCESGVGQSLSEPCKCGHPECQGTLTRSRE